MKVVFVDSVQLTFEVFRPTTRIDKEERSEEAMGINLFTEPSKLRRCVTVRGRRNDIMWSNFSGIVRIPSEEIR